MSLCNDLIGLMYGWGHRPGDGSGKTDCFQLMCEIHQRLGLKDYADDFDWAYRQFPVDGVPRIRLVRWLLENASPAMTVQPGDVAMMQNVAAFATVSDVGGLVYIGGSGRVVHAQVVPPNLRLFRPRP